MSENILVFLEAHHTKWLTLHILGVVLGLGGATISDLLFFRFLKDFRISKKEEEVLHLLKTLILGALAIIIVSGLALYLPATEKYNASAAFLVKVIAVGVVTLNGIALHAFVAPHLIHLNLKNHGKMGRDWHRLAFALGSVSFVSWYSIFLIAMLKSILPWSFSALLLIYVSLLLIGLAVSQVMERRLSYLAKQ